MNIDVQSNNKRIAKNTIYLYFRMFLTLLVGLYTSRVVLQTLGISDYGLYNVVGGFVSMLSFINATMATGTQRFLSFAIGQRDFEKLKSIFANAFVLHLLIAILIFILAETIGLWFLYTQMNVPDGRFDAALWTYQFSVLTLMVSVLQVPFMSSLVAHEKMNIYAYISVFDVIMKLLVVFMIRICDADKLILYAALMFSIQFLSAMLYNIYCHKQYTECRFSFRYNKEVLREMAGFSGWTIIGMLANTTNGQGINVLFNIFCGTIVNAARGIAFQVNNILMGFVKNFQIAANPQIIKLYAEGNFTEMTNLTLQSSKISAFLLLLIMLPFFVDIDFVLYFWLGKYPDLTTEFVRIVLLQSLIQSMTNPVVIVTHAAGKLKMPNLLGGLAILLSLPFSYWLLNKGYSPSVILTVNIIPYVIEGFFDSYFAQKYAGFSQKRFFKEVYLRVISVACLSMVVPFILTLIWKEQNLCRFLLLSAICVAFTTFFILFLGIDRKQRIELLSFLKQKIKI